MASSSHLLSEYDYHLPKENIAQTPTPKRDQSKLLILDTGSNKLLHHQFSEIVHLIRPGDVIVVNNTKVFPARLLGQKPTGGKAELFLLEYPTPVSAKKEGWCQAKTIALIKSSKRPKIGTDIIFSTAMHATITGYQDDGKAKVTLHFYQHSGETLESILEKHGQVPLPPYIERNQGTTADDKTRYQTKYAQYTGSVAAPTAGLHFSSEVLSSLERKGVTRAEITLHVGYGTFAPVRAEDIRDHIIHEEHVTISPEAAKIINTVKKNKGRVWAVGTTTVRSLEFSTNDQGKVTPFQGVCDLFIYPGYQFKIVDNLITNFHLPKSSLLFLVSALAGKERILDAYQEAIKKEYRFFSYGDAMAIITKA